jgi:hypothetical protein
MRWDSACLNTVMGVRVTGVFVEVQAEKKAALKTIKITKQKTFMWNILTSFRHLTSNQRWRVTFVVFCDISSLT